MPELPEVETVRLSLLKYLKGKTITDCQVFFNKVIKAPNNINHFIEIITGQKINNIIRRGKHLIFILDNDVLISHLRMEGKYYFTPKNEEGDWKHILVLFEIDDNYQLRYHDTRRFGTMHLYDKDQYELQPPLNKIGYEPFDKVLTATILQNKWGSKSQAIKSTLLTQNVITGIGNIYANEILFACKINPLTSTKLLSYQQLDNILAATRSTLSLAIKEGGTTIATYHPEPGIDGKFVQQLQVHGRTNLSCYRCHHKIKKIYVNKRGTYYCPNCQKP